jgi:hypothetical protein
VEPIAVHLLASTNWPLPAPAATLPIQASEDDGQPSVLSTFDNQVND